jgi:hypothetical protein
MKSKNTLDIQLFAHDAFLSTFIMYHQGQHIRQPNKQETTATSGLRYFSTRALQFENLTIDCNPLVAEGEYVYPITKASKVSNFRR